MGSPEMVSIIAKKIAIKRQYNALCAVFDQADITRDGTISIAEYMALCEEYGVALDDNDIQEIKDLADHDGEIHKVDFILHIKNSRLLKHFETVDPYSRIHWKKKVKWMTSNKKIDHKKVDALFERMDLDGDGKLDYDEFTTLIFNQKDRKLADASLVQKRKFSKPKIKATKKKSSTSS